MTLPTTHELIPGGLMYRRARDEVGPVVRCPTCGDAYVEAERWRLTVVDAFTRKAIDGPVVQIRARCVMGCAWAVLLRLDVPWAGVHWTDDRLEQIGND